MKTQTPQHATNLTRIVSALIIAEQANYTDLIDPYDRKQVNGLVERAEQIYGQILDHARYFEFKPSYCFDENGGEIEVTQ